jgi:hypothetical protein
MIKTVMMRWVGNVAHMGKKQVSRKSDLKKPKRKREIRRQTQVG